MKGILIATLTLALACPLWAATVFLPFNDTFETYADSAAMEVVWTDTTGHVSLTTARSHSATHSMLNNADSKVQQDANIEWSPEMPIRVSFWFFFDGQGAANDKLDKFARMSNDGVGAPGTSGLNFGAYWSGQVAVPNGAGLVDGREGSYANLSPTFYAGTNCTTHMVWWEWIFEAQANACTITANGSNFLTCNGIPGGVSGAAEADIVANPWNKFHVGAFYGTSFGRGWFYLDDVTVEQPPAVSDWASY